MEEMEMRDGAAEEYLRGFFAKWYRRQGRAYPWRDRRVSAYGILIAEIMLRKTQADRVVSPWLEFTSRFPSPSACLESNDLDLQSLLLPLGLSRTRTTAVKQICRMIVEEHGGKLPERAEILQTLPHIGVYTANAIACFAYNKRAAIVDGNVIRVISRISGRRPTRDNRRVPEVWEAANRILPRASYREHNYGMLDFAASICRARIPRCASCSLAGICNESTGRTRHHDDMWPVGTTRATGREFARSII